MEPRIFFDKDSQFRAWEDKELDLRTEIDGVYAQLMETERYNWAEAKLLQELFLHIRRNEFMQRTRVISPTWTLLLFLVFNGLCAGISVGNAVRAWNSDTNGNCNHLTCTIGPVLVAPAEVPFRIAAKIAAAD